MRILIVFASKNGQTRKIATVLGAELGGLGHEVSWIDLNRLDRGYLVEDFDAVLVGAPVYRSKYPSVLRSWVKKNARALSSKPSAFYSVCLGILERKNIEAQLQEQKIVQEFFGETGWRPGQYAIFAGALAYRRYNWLIRLVMKRIAAKAGGDTDTSRDYEYTNWNAVRQFALEFAGHYLKSA